MTARAARRTAISVAALATMVSTAVGQQRTGAVNLTRPAKYTASSTWDDATYAAIKAFDGHPNTRWNSRRDETNGAWLAAQWDRPVTVRHVVVRQAFDRITGLKLQVLDDRTKAWQTVAALDGKELTRQKNGRAGRTPDDGSVNPVFTLRLGAPAQTNSLRLLIASVVPMQQGSVSIVEFEVFGEPAGAPPPNRNGARANLSYPDAVTEPPSWNDANTPFDLAEFLKAPPAEENAAPLYLDAFYEFDPQTMADILFPDMPMQEKEAWWPAARAIRKEGWRLDEAWEKDPQSVAAADVDAWLANYDVGFEKLAAAQQRPKCRFHTGLSFHSPLVHNQAAQQVARVVEWRTRRDLERGDLDLPIQDLKSVLRLSRDLQPGAPFGVLISSSALNSHCCELGRTILNAPGVDVRRCDALLALLVEHEAKTINAFREANRADYIFSRQALHDLQRRTGSFDPQRMNEIWGESGDATSPLACIKIINGLDEKYPEKLAKEVTRLRAALLPGAWQGGKMLSDEDYAKEVEALNRFSASILALAERPNFWQSGKAEIETAAAPLKETTLARFIAPPAESMLDMIRRGKARLRGTQCLVALRRWQLEHAEAPPDLETLVKAAGMPGAPMDPYSEQSLRMGSVAGKTVIYSVGPDGKDDKAQVEWDYYGPRQSGDIIFQIEKPPPQ